MSINWTATGNGAFVIGEYKVEMYFIKRFTMGPRIPSKSIPEPVYSEQMEVAKWLENKQAEMRKLLKGLTTLKDHVVVEEENFWDAHNLFTTVTRLIPNENKGADYTKMTLRTFVKLCADIALLIKKIHDAGVTHGDIKEKNILIQKKGSELIPYLIDFDLSYPSDYGTRKRANGKPMLAYPVGFSEGYQSPEIAIYNFESEGKIDASTISNKTDIFSLAIVFHKLWTNNYPAVIEDACPVGEAVYLDTPIKLDAKFDVVLGSNKKCKFSSLLFWMLAKDAKKRPSAQQIIDVLEDKIDVEDIYETPAAADRFDVKPHDLHKAALIIFGKETLKKKGVKAFVKITEGGQYKYLVKLSDGTEKSLTVDEVIAEGYGKINKETSALLWADDADHIEIVDLKEISRQGVLSIEPKEAGFKKFYFVALRAGGGYTTSAKGLVDRGLAKYKTIAEDPEFNITPLDKPWPAHGAAYNIAALKKRNVIEVEKYDDKGTKKYLITMRKGEGKLQNVVNAAYMKIMRFIV